MLGGEDPGPRTPPHHVSACRALARLEFALATPVVVFGGRGFYREA